VVERTMLVATNCVFLFALPALLLASTHRVGLIAAGAVVNGIAGQLFGVLWTTTLHRKIKPEMLSRVSAYDNLGSIVLAPLALVAAGSALESLGATFTLLIAAAMVIGPTALALLDRDVRTLRLA
jgi:hypothetical protein